MCGFEERHLRNRDFCIEFERPLTDHSLVNTQLNITKLGRRTNFPWFFWRWGHFFKRRDLKNLKTRAQCLFELRNCQPVMQEILTHRKRHFPCLSNVKPGKFKQLQRESPSRIGCNRCRLSSDEQQPKDLTDSHLNTQNEMKWRTHSSTVKSINKQTKFSHLFFQILLEYLFNPYSISNEKWEQRVCIYRRCIFT